MTSDTTLSSIIWPSMIVSLGKFSKPRLTRLRLFSLPSSSTIFIELEPISRPATLFFLPNIIFLAPCWHFLRCFLYRKVFSCFHPKFANLACEDLLPPIEKPERRGYSFDRSTLRCTKDAHFSDVS